MQDFKMKFDTRKGLKAVMHFDQNSSTSKGSKKPLVTTACDSLVPKRTFFLSKKSQKFFVFHFKEKRYKHEMNADMRC
jgi:hypothetical protein